MARKNRSRGRRGPKTIRLARTIGAVAAGAHLVIPFVPAVKDKLLKGDVMGGLQGIRDAAQQHLTVGRIAQAGLMYAGPVIVAKGAKQIGVPNPRIGRVALL